jgi:hypothetical protein
MSGAPLGVERAPPVFRVAVVCVSPSWGTDERPVRYWTMVRPTSPKVTMI